MSLLDPFGLKKNAVLNALKIFKDLQGQTKSVLGLFLRGDFHRESVAWEVVLSFEARRSSLRRRTAAWMYSCGHVHDRCRCLMVSTVFFADF